MIQKIPLVRITGLIIACLILLGIISIIISNIPITTKGDSPFSENTKVNTDAMMASQGDPTIVVDSDGTIYAVWQDGRHDTSDVYFAKSTDRGSTWTDPNVKVNTDTGTALQFSPDIAVDDDGNIYAAWEDTRDGDRNIYFGKSTDGGATWTDPNVRVNSDAGTANQEGAAIAVDSAGNIYVAWDDNRNGDYDIYFAKSTDGGATWTDPNIRLNSDEGATTQAKPILDVSPSDTIYAAWTDMRNGNSDVYLTYSADGGSTWLDSDRKINSDVGTTDQSSPALDFDSSGTIYAAWTDKRNGDSDIYFAKSMNGGTTWTNPNLKINSDLGTKDQFQPTITVDDNGAIYAAWQDDRNNEYDIYFCSSVNGGTTWSDPNIRANDDSSGYAQASPSIALDSSGDTLYLVWEDARDYETTNYDIFITSLDAETHVQNDPPTISNKASAPTTATVNSTVSFKFIGDDSDSDPLTWSKISGPNWLHIGPTNGTIYGTPSPEDEGSNDVSIQVNDGKGGVDDHTWTIVVYGDSGGNGQDQENNGNGDNSWLVWLVIIIVGIIILLVVLMIFKGMSGERM